MIPQKLQDVGCTSTNTHTSYRGECIYIKNGCCYPTICNGYKDAAKCATLEDAQKWIDEKKKRGGARIGAGRKKVGDGILYCHMKKKTIDYIKKSASADGLPVGAWIEKKLNL